jgi:hypothetical protein
MTTPRGSESTGLTFSPDYKYGFVSIQHPSAANNTVVQDAAGNEVVFNNAATIVFARKQFLGKEENKGGQLKAELVAAYPNPFRTSVKVRVTLPGAGEVVLEVLNDRGEAVATLAQGTLSQGEHLFEFTPPAETAPGNATYFLRSRVNNALQVTRLIRTQE